MTQNEIVEHLDIILSLFYKNATTSFKFTK